MRTHVTQDADYTLKELAERVAAVERDMMAELRFCRLTDNRATEYGVMKDIFALVRMLREVSPLVGVNSLNDVYEAALATTPTMQRPAKELQADAEAGRLPPP